MQLFISLALFSQLTLVFTYQTCVDFVHRISSPKPGQLIASLYVTTHDLVNLTQAEMEITFTDEVKLNVTEFTIDGIKNLPTLQTKDNLTFTLTGIKVNNSSITIKVDFDVSFEGVYIDVSQVSINNHIQCSGGEICGEIPSSQFLIQRGTVVQHGDWPWLAAIFHTTQVTTLNFVCGGTLVTDKHVITAAHCVRDVNSYCELVDRKQLIVGLGVNKLFDIEETKVQKFGVSGVVVHPDWGVFRKDADLAVLVLSRSVIFTDYVRPACLHFDDRVETQGTVVGWGLKEDGEFNVEPQTTKLPIVSNDVCRASDVRFEPITSDRTFCAGLRDGAGPCKGDSGGGFYTVTSRPADRSRVSVSGVVSRALVNETLLGVCDLSKYTIFTRLGSYTQWIKLTTNQPEHQSESITGQIDRENEIALQNLLSGNYTVAYGQFDRVLEGRLCTLGADDRNTLRAFHTIAVTAFSLESYDEALDTLDEIIPKQTELLGAEDAETLASLHSKAATLAKLGRLNEALALYLDVLEKRNRVLGELNEASLYTMINTVLVLIQLGLYQDALLMSTQLVEKLRRVLGEEHVRTIMAQHNKAFALEQVGRPDEALELYNIVIDKRNKILGPYHEDTLASMLNKATLLYGLGRYDEATQLIDKVLETQTLVGLTDRMTHIQALNLKALLLNTYSNFNSALSIYDEVINKSNTFLGANSSTTFKAILNKAFTLNNLGRYIEALHLYDEVIANQTLVFGASHVDTLEAQHNRAYTLFKLARNDEALQVYDDVIKMRRIVLGDMHEATIKSLMNYAAVLDNLGRHQEALPVHQQVLENRRRLLGDYHENTLSAVNNMAVNLVKLGRFQEAMRLMDMVVEARAQLLGEANMLTIIARYNKQQAIKKYKESQEKQLVNCESLKDRAPIVVENDRYLISTEQHNCMRPSLFQASWAEARDRCRSQRLELVTIQDQTRNQRLIRYLLQEYQDNWVFWIGASDPDKQGLYKWSGTAQPLNFTYWLDYNPRSEGCVAIYGSVHPHYCSEGPCAGKWNDESCDHRWNYICEIQQHTCVVN